MKTKDPSLLKEISKDLFYEVNHLIELFLLLKLKEQHSIKNHAFLESLLIHARNIFFFLYNDYNPKYPKDVLALHFVSNIDEWNEFKQTQLAKNIYKDFRKRIAREIAHLSFNRIDKTEKNIGWDLHFVIDLIQGIDKLIECVPSELFHKDWEKYKSLRNKICSDEENLLFKKWVYSTH